MDIRDWPLDKIMQLPDCCFGRRWPMIFGDHVTTGASMLYVSEAGLPDVAVLWEVWAVNSPSKIIDLEPDCRFSFSLTNQLVVIASEFPALEPIFPVTEPVIAQGRFIHSPFHMVKIKQPVKANGRRVCLYWNPGTMAQETFCVVMIFSSVPTEVPDCYRSA